MPVINKKLTAQEFFKAMRDTSLSMKLRGALATLQALEIGDEFTVSELAERVPDSYTAIMGHLRKLEDAGYLERKQVRDRYGHVQRSEYTLKGVE